MGPVAVRHRRTSLGAVVGVGLWCALFAPGASAAPSYTQVGYIPLSDGTQLQYTVIRPSEQRRFPTLLNYAAYNSGIDPTSSSQTEVGPYEQAVLDAGFALIGVNVRGTGCSSGQFDTLSPQWSTDGYQAVEWIARQSWSNGHVSMMGVSLPGVTQWMVAGTRPPHLDSIVPASTIGDLFRDIANPGGIPNSAFNNFYLVAQNAEASEGLPSAVAQGNYQCPDNYALHLPSEGTNIPQGEVQHPYDDADVVAHSPGRQMNRIDIPVLAFTQWQDEQVGSRVSTGFGVLDPDKTWIVASNGDHSWPNCSACFALALRFWRWTLMGQDTGFQRVPHVQLFYDDTGTPDGELPGVSNFNPSAATQGWSLAFKRWPPPTSDDVVYLHSGGLLAATRPHADESSDSYQYPQPSPTVDDAGVSQWEGSPSSGGSVAYTTAPFKYTRVFFDAGLDLWLSSTATDTDLQVTLTEVRPDGQEQYIARGWLRASYRALAAGSTPINPIQSDQPQDAKPLTPGVPTEMQVQVFPFSQAIRKGDRLRVIVDAPTGMTGFWGFNYLPTPATNTILHDPAHPSHLTLGLIGTTTPRIPEPACGTLTSQPCRANTYPLPAGVDDQPAPRPIGSGDGKPRACTKARAITLHPRAPRGQRIRRVSVTVNGRRVRVRHGIVHIDLQTLARRTVIIRVTIITSRGRRIARRVVIHRCPAKQPPRHKHRKGK